MISWQLPSVCREALAGMEQNAPCAERPRPRPWPQRQGAARPERGQRFGLTGHKRERKLRRAKSLEKEVARARFLVLLVVPSRRFLTGECTRSIRPDFARKFDSSYFGAFGKSWRLCLINGLKHQSVDVLIYDYFYISPAKASFEFSHFFAPSILLFITSWPTFLHF